MMAVFLDLVALSFAYNVSGIRFVSFLVAVFLSPRMSQKPIFCTGCVFHADILDRVFFSYQYFRQGSIFV